MKKNTIYSLVLLLSLNVFAVTGCKKKQGCKDNSASNYDKDAKEDDGSCVYYADLYVGSYNMEVKETRPTSTKTIQYVIVISKESNNVVKISNLAGGGGIVSGDVNSSGLQISTQYWGAPIGGTVSGSGKINGSELSVNFTYNNNTINGEGKGSKQ